MDSAPNDLVDPAIQCRGTRRIVLAGLAGFTPLLSSAVASSKNRKRRRQKRKRRQEAPPQSWPFLYVSLFIHNQRTAPLSVREWNWEDGGEIGIGLWRAQEWKVLAAKPAAGPEPFFDFVRDDDEVVVELSSGHVIDASNPALGYPHLSLWVGKWSEQGLDKGSTWETLLDAGLDVNERRTIAGFQVQRLTDADSHKRFQVNLI